MCLRSSQDNEEQTYSTLKSKNTSARVSGLKPGTKYIFQIRARTSAGCGRFSQNVEIQTGKAGEFVCWRHCKEQRNQSVQRGECVFMKML